MPLATGEVVQRQRSAVSGAPLLCLDFCETETMNCPARHCGGWREAGKVRGTAQHVVGAQEMLLTGIGVCRENCP